MILDSPCLKSLDRVIVFDSQNSHNVSTEFGMNQDFISSSYAGSFVGVNSSSQQSEIEGQLRHLQVLFCTAECLITINLYVYRWKRE